MAARVGLPLLFSICWTIRTGLGMGGSIRLTECPSDASDVTYSWNNDGDSLYVEGDGSCVTLSDIYNGADNAPLVPMNATGEEVDVETG